jgi:NADPH:quinone reductase-like Zn-dependent oxidoreductase
VAIRAASINPVDWKAAQGAFREVIGTVFPLVLGVDGAGRVEALGAGRFAVGDRRRPLQGGRCRPMADGPVATIIGA